MRLVQGALTTQDVDLLWDGRQRVGFMTVLGRLETSMLGVLQRADPTYERKEGQNATAISAKGFEVDFVRHQPEGNDPRPFRFSDDEGTLWPVQAVRALVQGNAPRFGHVVVSATGRMTPMRTIAPQVFVEFKRLMAKKAVHRPEPKRRPNLRRADIVQKLLYENLLSGGT